MENPPPSPGGISADVFWGENIKGEEKKGENVFYHDGGRIERQPKAFSL